MFAFLKTSACKTLTRYEEYPRLAGRNTEAPESRIGHKRWKRVSCWGYKKKIGSAGRLKVACRDIARSDIGGSEPRS